LINWYQAITQCTHPVNVLTAKLGIKIVRKRIPTRRSVAFLYSCGRTVGWIKMPLGKEVGLDPGHSAVCVNLTTLSVLLMYLPIIMCAERLSCCQCWRRPQAAWVQGSSTFELISNDVTSQSAASYGLNRKKACVAN